MQDYIAQTVNHATMYIFRYISSDLPSLGMYLRNAILHISDRMVATVGSRLEIPHSSYVRYVLTYIR